MNTLVKFAAVLAIIAACVSSQVLELSDSFLDGRLLQQPWLVMFYAPWCGHCKHLTPVYEAVARTLRSSGIHVGKIDATRFNEAARKYAIRGFPTIKFISGSEVTDFHGERTADAIAKFALRSAGPAVRALQGGRMPDNLEDEAVSFVYVGKETHPLHGAFTRLAVKNRLDALFFTSPVLPVGFPLERKSEDNNNNEARNSEDSPSVFVVKEPRIIKAFPDASAPAGAAESSLSSWVEAERWPRLMEISAMALRQLADVEKVALVAVVEKSKEKHDVNKLLKDMLRVLTEDSAFSEDGVNKVQFGFTHDLTLISSITIGYVTPPAVIAIQAETSRYSIAPLDEAKVESAPKDEKAKEEVARALRTFVEAVIDEKTDFHGGRGWMMSIRRLIHEIFSTIIAIWMESPILGALVFGLPSLVISFICYMLCCMETVDGPESDDVYEDDGWDSEDEYIGDGLEAGDGGHVEGSWQRHEGGGGGRGGGGDGGMALRKRIGIDEETTWNDVLRENDPVQSN